MSTSAPLILSNKVQISTLNKRFNPFMCYNLYVSYILVEDYFHIINDLYDTEVAFYFQNLLYSTKNLSLPNFQASR
jgi:hypothetical protein